MDAEASKQIAELALKTFPDCTYRMEGFLKGAQAAWTLAVGWERERIKNVIESAGKYTNGLHNSIFNTILTPEEEKT